MKLHQYLLDAAQRWPSKVAIQELDGSSITYEDLDAQSSRLRDRLASIGVQPGDRVGFWLHKSADAVVTLFAILKAGAAYVPIDPTGPAARNNYILADCRVAAIVIEERFKPMLEVHGDEGWHPAILDIDEAGGRKWVGDALTHNVGAGTSLTVSPVGAHDLAFILYTSGSTGKPKGVQLTHENASSFIEWCARTFSLTSSDRFSSHAPFHFDLSVFDIFGSVKHGGTLLIISEEVGKQPYELAQLIADHRITVWYSAPSILSLMAQFGYLDTRDYSALRLVLFAGEVFPINHLKLLTTYWPHPQYFNLYGPTETNVCTYYQVPTPIPADQMEPVPIGRVCSHLEGILVQADGTEMSEATEGELCIHGPAVTRGYWNLPEQSQRCFVEVNGRRYYRTGDIVREEGDGNLVYLGRKDRMIKKRGFRVELGEIEVCLYRHPDIREAAVVALADDSVGMRVHAHIVSKQGKPLSLIDMKTFCSEHIPIYMIPDRFSFHSSLPKTSTDKIDYQTLKSWSRS
ncbi:amino acid adenylation domain-containing protein [Microvirga makkahensis]|uniref:Amino acid adenylation domain-containing protein n=1 Tax=Microvirga makkahensis TaxID=1128670 RepID=A0A7X3SQJ3_9HYPH|nr:amino acid adenylation domain-containing protein [Microvirga makkahensis]MXQ13577.1 amino acid adenylation domain-containing protein [Microvirga makkahensis]